MEKIRGSAMVMVLVFSAVFIMAVGSLLQYVLEQIQLTRSKTVREEALQVAEAGLEYYKWHLAHNPNSSWEGTVAYADPESGSRIGSFSVATSNNVQCGDILTRDVTVTGMIDADPRFTRTVSARYTYPSVANYSYLVGADVWAGSSRTIVGPYYSSGGIRMDATHNSLVGSGVGTWQCDGSFGCNPTQAKPGVWGSGSNPELWQYPVSLVDFGAMTPDFGALKSKAQSYGQYFSSFSNGVPTKGYHLIFKSNGTFDVYRVTSTDYDYGWLADGSSVKEYHRIKHETFVGNFTVPGSCALIYVEDLVWIEGVVSGKMALVVADTVHDYDPEVVLQGNLTYAHGASQDGLVVLGEKDILIPARSLDSLTLQGIFVASGGEFGRHHYVQNAGYYWDFGSGTYIYDSGVGSYQDRNTLTINGTIVSAERVGTSWTYGLYKWNGHSWQYIEEDSGYAYRESAYERAQAFGPPPFTPRTTSIPQYVDWHEGP